MLTAIHPDRPVLFVRADVDPDRCECLRLGIFFFPDTRLHRPMEDVWAVVHLALMLAKREPRGVPRVGREPRAFSDREAGVVAELRAWATVGLVLVLPLAPIAAQRDLAGRRRRQHC